MRADIKPELDALSGKVIKSAFAVARALGHGFLEAVYKNALAVELERAGIEHQKEQIALQFRQAAYRCEAGPIMKSVFIRGCPCASVLLQASPPQ